MLPICRTLSIFWVFFFFFKKILAILVSVMYLLHKRLYLHFPDDNEFQHLFICVLAIWKSSFVKSLQVFFPTFKLIYLFFKTK